MMFKLTFNRCDLYWSLEVNKSLTSIRGVFFDGCDRVEISPSISSLLTKENVLEVFLKEEVPLASS